MKLGTRDVEALHLGNRTVTRVMLGDQLVWEIGGGGGGGFPIIAATANTVRNSVSTSHVIDLPAGVTAGDDLLAIVRLAHNTVTLTEAAGWAALVKMSGFLIMRRVADGSEGATVTITSNFAQYLAAVTLRVTGSAQTPTAASLQNISRSPQVIASWGSAQNLFLAITSTLGSGTYTPPTNYSRTIEVATTGVQACVLAVAFRELEADRDTPGVWSFSAGTSAVRSATVVLGP